MSHLPFCRMHVSLDLLRNGFGENNTFDAYVLRKQSR